MLIFIYIAMKNPGLHDSRCKALGMLASNESDGYGSHLVLFELFGAMSKINVEAAYETVNSYLNFPLNMLGVE